ncbi:MAG TPA: crossover junction endodeoxyribonuclease RuvC [Candidatus Eisenbacteria bacterium]|nr:crossover junction endodeoxyribonuclease RuvC [Candidatus Eisenbacteria bacterium]
MGVAPGRDAANVSARARRILGVDPGSIVTGWGVVEAAGGCLRYVAHGTIVSSAAESQETRLQRIYRGLTEALSVYSPDGISLERVFFARNAQSTLKLGQARGVALLAAALNQVKAYEYSAAEIKMAVVGYGHATKEQVQMMVASLLSIPAELGTDPADALAAAICHLHRQAFESRVARALARPLGARRRDRS